MNNKTAICLICNSDKGLVTFVDSLITFPRLAARQLCIATNGALSATRAAKICEARGIVARVSHGSYMKNGIFGFAAARAASFALASDCDFIMTADDDFRFQKRRQDNVGWAISSDDALDEAIAFLNDHKDVGLVQLCGFLGGAPFNGKLRKAVRLEFSTGRGHVFRAQHARFMPASVLGAGADDQLFGAMFIANGFDVYSRFGVMTKKKPSRHWGPGCTDPNYSDEVVDAGIQKYFQNLTGNRFVINAAFPKGLKALHDRAHL